MSPSLLEPPPARGNRPSRYRRWAWRRRLKRAAVRVVVVALLVATALGTWYIANKGFGRQWRRSVTEELRKRGIEATVQRLTLDPFRGLVAQGVRVYDARDRETPLAVISEVALDINYSAVLHHQPFLNALYIRGANVAFPRANPDPAAPRAELTQFHAHVYFPPEQIHVAHAEGFFCGIRIASAAGQLINRPDATPREPWTEEEWRQRMAVLQRVAAELRRFSFGDDPPVLQMNFAADLQHPETAHVEAVLSGENIRLAEYELSRVHIAAEWLGQKLTISRLEWSDALGQVTAAATWDNPTRRAEFQLRSTIDLPAFLSAAGWQRAFSDVQLASKAQIEASGTGDFSMDPPQLSVIGSTATGPFSFRGVSFLGFAAQFSWDRARTMLRGVRVRHQTGELKADVLDAPGDFRLHVDSRISPAIARPLVDAGLAKFLGEWEWPEPPAIQLQVRGSSRDPGTWAADGTIALQRTRFRGVWMNSATADVRVADGALTFNNLRVKRDEGTGTGAFTYDFKRHEVRVENVRTTLWPAEAIHWIEPKLHKVVAPYRFEGVPRVSADGVVTFRGRRETHLALHVDAPRGMEYVFAGKTLPFRNVSGDLLVTDDRVRIDGVRGTLFGGRMTLNADVTLGPGAEPYHAVLTADGVDFPSLTQRYFDYETSRGQLSGTYEWSARGDDARAMIGQGSVKVSNGNVFAIPVFGPLSGFIASVVPGAGYSVAKQAVASFTIRDGVIHTDDLKVSGKLFGMRGHGDIHFLDDKLQFDVRINGRGPGMVLTPVYSLFEYTGEGSLRKPNWHPKRF